MSLVGYIKAHLTNLVSTEEISNVNLAELASDIPDIHFGSRAKNTRSSYLRAFSHCKDWIDSFNLPSIPANPLHLTLYFVSMIQGNSSFNKLNQTFYALKWIHRLVNCKDPCHYPMVMATVESAFKTCSKERTYHPPPPVQTC